MTGQNRALEILREAGALRNGHFLLTSGRHTGQYLQIAKVFRHPGLSSELCSMLAQTFSDMKADVVVGPAMGAVQMAYELSRQLGCENMFAERENGALTLRRGFAVRPGQRVLVVEDVITTGGSVRELMALVRASGGEIVGVGAVADRSGGQVDFGVPFYAAATLEGESWDRESCPLCKSGGSPQVPGGREG